MGWPSDAVVKRMKHSLDTTQGILCMGPKDHRMGVGIQCVMVLGRYGVCLIRHAKASQLFAASTWHHFRVPPRNTTRVRSHSMLTPPESPDRRCVIVSVSGVHHNHGARGQPLADGSVFMVYI